MHLDSSHPHRLASGSYDVCLVMLGANDLLSYISAGQPPPPEAVDGLIEHLKQLHSACQSSGAKAVSLGLLDHPAINQMEGGPAALTAINSRIANEAGADTFIEAAKLVLASQSALWSSDHVHMQSEGYATLARELAVPLAAIMQDSDGKGHKARKNHATRG